MAGDNKEKKSYKILDKSRRRRRRRRRKAHGETVSPKQPCQSSRYLEMTGAPDYKAEAVRWLRNSRARLYAANNKRVVSTKTS